MGEVKDRLLEEIGEETKRLVEAEKALAEIRDRLHTLIRAAGSGTLDKDEKSGPSAIAKAMNHRYTREYIGTLLKTPAEAEQIANLVLWIQARGTQVHILDENLAIEYLQNFRPDSADS